MPIEEAIKIIKDGANTHFDARVTNMFLSLPCDKIIDVTLSDGDVILDVESRKILEQHDLFELETIINKEEKTPEEIKLINTFNDFYIRKPRKAED